MSDTTAQSANESANEPNDQLVYVSWGGTGRAAALRKTMVRADERSASLLYLGILDDSTFGDIDPPMVELAKEELSWLLDAQLELAARQTGLDDVAVRVVVRAGDVADGIVDVVNSNEGVEVLIGGPVPEGSETVVDELLAILKGRVDAPVSIIEP